MQNTKSEAERANKAKSEFLAKMSHELRTPLNAVIGYSEMMLEDMVVAGREAQSDDIRKINSAGKHLLMLVSDVLDLSKLDAGKMQIFSEQFDLGALIHDVVANCRDAVEANGNTLVLDCPKNLGTVESDTAKLRQALMNLMSNGGKFTDHGTVTLKVRITDGWIEIAVHDTGVGIGAENLSKLFQNFGQDEGATPSKYGGTGLGLVLSQKICRLMGGDITVQSKLGVGSCFTMRVPADLGQGEAPARPFVDSQAHQPDPQVGRGRILIIDNDPAIRDLMHRILTKEGYLTVVTESASEGLSVAREAKPTAILLDVFMPEMDGWEVMRTLKADKDLCDCPVVLLTVSDDLQKSRALGAAAHLVKPVDRDVLLRLLERLCPEYSGRENVALAS